MTETQKRIRAYKKALPELRERVIAVALLLAMSASMLTSASFAWITLSTAPEASGMTTTVAANGNLEIALVDAEGNEPGESKAGDSSAIQGIALSNLTWGNLVNLSDPSYGLDHIALRPALLSDYNLNKYPLYGATYGGDGRVVSTSDRYEFATWTEAADGTKYFAAGNDSTYGVRAIASVKYENITGNAVFTEMWTRMESAYGQAKTTYADMIDGKTTLDDKGTTCIDALIGLITIFAQDKVDTMLGDEEVYSDCSGYIRYFYLMMEEFDKILGYEGAALLELANLQAWLNDESVGTGAFGSLDELMNASTSELASLGVELESLSNYKANVKDLKAGMAEMKPLSDACDPDDPNREPVYWNEISGVVNTLVDVNNATLNGVRIGSLSGSNISSVLGGGDVVITKGILKDSEQRIGELMADHNVAATIKIKAMGLPYSVSATVKTSAEKPFTSSTDKEHTEALNAQSGGSGDAVAKDTYGMAIDLWVRTNAKDAVLTLEGQTVYTEVDAMGINKNGAETVLYVLSTEDGDADVYSLEDVWYYADNHEAVEETVLETATPVKKVEQVVAGYEGENRIWENWEDMLEAGLIEEDSTTQGSGSCFVFYANPSDQAKILELLAAFSVAFVNGEGKELGTAVLDIDRAYAINGKVTVPLQVSRGAEYTDEDGNSSLGITALNQNEATRITAIVYLNGMRLENENVLANGEIQGMLNIQFGSSVSLTNPENEELQAQYRTITAVATSGEQTSASEASPITFDYDGAAKTVDVTLKVEGEQPERISAFFVRTINSTQGTRGDTADFKQNEDGTWSASFVMTTPGDYLLRSLTVDGAEYTLDAFPKVSIAGLTISNVSTSLKSGIHMTADSALDVTVTAKIEATPELMPSQVRAQFRSADGKEFNAIMTYDSDNGRWVGTASITSSGTYTLEYLVMDGEYTELSAQNKTTLIVYLGMTSRIWTTLSPTTFQFTESVDIPIQAEVRDDSGTAMRGLTGVMLYYHASGSSLDQNGMYTELKWDSSTGYYEGTLLMEKAGSYSFDRLQVTNAVGDSSTIRKAANAPVFTAIPPDPPEYYSYIANEYQVALDNSAALQLQLAYAQSAKVWANIVNKNTGNAALVLGTASNLQDVTLNGKEAKINDFTFKIPTNSGGNQDGEWQITELYFQDVYVNGKLYSYTGDEIPAAEDCYIMDVSGKGGDNGIYAYVVSTLKASVKQNNAAYTGSAFGGTKDAPTGAFLESYTLEGLTVTVTDWNNRAVQNLDSVVWSITYDNTTDTTYGGYDGATQSQNDVILTSDSTGTVYTAATQTFKYAGVYNTTIAANFTDGLSGVVAKPVITVSSVKPSAKITGITPTGSNATKITYTEKYGTPTFTAGDDKTSSKTDYAATVYALAKAENTRQRRGSFTQPTLTITASGIGNAEKATLTLPAGSADAITYEFSGNVAMTKTLGKTAVIEEWKLFGFGHELWAYYGHETQTITTMTLTKDGVTYTVTLDNPLVITNPSSVNQS